MKITSVLLGSFLDAPFVSQDIHVGPGRKTLHTRHKNVDTNVYHRMEATAINTEARPSRQQIIADEREAAKELVRVKKTGVIIGRRKLESRSKP